MGKKAGALLNATEKAAAAERIVQKDGERIGSMIDDLSRTGAKADVEALVAAQRTKVASEVATAVSPDATREAGRFAEWLDTIENKVGKAAGGDVKALWEARRELRKDIDWKKPSTPATATTTGSASCTSRWGMRSRPPAPAPGPSSAPTSPPAGRTPTGTIARPCGSRKPRPRGPGARGPTGCWGCRNSSGCSGAWRPGASPRCPWRSGAPWCSTW